MPYHELVELLVRHLFLPIVGSTLYKGVLKLFLSSNGGNAQQVVHLFGNALFRAGIVGMQQAAFIRTVFGDIVNHLVVLTHGLCPMRGGIEPMTV